jgi:hypothetical protein
MGGKSTTSGTKTESATTNPWGPSEGVLKGILGQLNNNLGETGLTGNESDALSTMTAAGKAGNPFAGQIGNFATELLNGGGANNQAGNIYQNYQEYQRRLNPIANGANIGPEGNPALKGYLDTISNDVQTRVNGMFAGAGRDLSGSNVGTVARGIAEGTAPILAQQYNTDVGNMRSAADALYGAGNTNAGLLTGMQQQGLANKQVGVGAAGAAQDAKTSGARSLLEAEAMRRGIPVQALGLLAQIGIPIAGLGGTSTGTATSKGEHEMSGIDKFAKISSGLSSLFGGGSGSSAASGIFKMISDRRAKEDIAQVGVLFDGTPVYRFRYIGQPAFQIGLMAQDVEKVTPEAVGQIGQYKAVDYKLATDKALEAA